MPAALLFLLLWVLLRRHLVKTRFCHFTFLPNVLLKRFFLLVIIPLQTECQQGFLCGKLSKPIMSIQSCPSMMVSFMLVPRKAGDNQNRELQINVSSITNKSQRPYAIKTKSSLIKERYKQPSSINSISDKQPFQSATKLASSDVTRTVEISWKITWHLLGECWCFNSLIFCSRMISYFYFPTAAAWLVKHSKYFVVSDFQRLDFNHCSILMQLNFVISTDVAGPTGLPSIYYVPYCAVQVFSVRLHFIILTNLGQISHH